MRNSGRLPARATQAWYDSIGSALELDFSALWKHVFIQEYLPWHG